jgi:hypothetical protein
VPPLSRQQSPITAHLAPVASTSSGARYLNRDPASRLTCLTPSPVTAVSTEQVEGGHPIERCDSALDLLTLATEGSHGLAKPRSEWQRDEDSAFCAVTDCTAFFPVNSRFNLLPSGRHHCRMCGLVYCSSHSSRCLPLTGFTDGVRRITRERVCDTCVSTVLPSAIESDDHSASGSEFSRIGSELTASTTRSDALLTPEEGGSSLTRSLSSPLLVETVDEEPMEDLAPIESWMDPSGILSLYPLAARSSKTLPNKPPAAAPLFRPTIAERRMAREHSVQKRERSLEQRRGQIEQFWLPIGASDFSRPTSRRNSLVKRTPEELPTVYLTPDERAADWSSF